MEQVKDLLIVIDMQNDFIGGKLANPLAEDIIPACQAKIRSYINDNKPIIFTRDTHDNKYMESLEGKHLPIPHCIKDSEGWQIHSDLLKVFDDFEERPDNIRYIDKPTFGFRWDKEKELFKELERCSKIEIIGTCTDICVVSNVLILKALLPHTEIYVDANCCAGLSEEVHNAALITMKQCQVNVEE